MSITYDPDFEPPHDGSPTETLLAHMALFGHREDRDGPDPRPLPDDRSVAAALADIFDALISTFEDTSLEPALADLLWSQVNLFHRVASRLERDLDANEQAQRRSQRDQDGSEIRSLELERLLVAGPGAHRTPRRLRGHARPRRRSLPGPHRLGLASHRPGSKVNHRALTSAMIDSRDFPRGEAAQPRPRSCCRPDQRSPSPAATSATITPRSGPLSTRSTPSTPGMVLLHGGSPKGAERIAACWADSRHVAQVAFRPDFTRHRKAAPFKRNDQLLDLLPIGVVVFPGSGISDNLADKAKAMGIPLFDFRPRATRAGSREGGA